MKCSLGNNVYISSFGCSYLIAEWIHCSKWTIFVKTFCKQNRCVSLFTCGVQHVTGKPTTQFWYKHCEFAMILSQIPSLKQNKTKNHYFIKSHTDVYFNLNTSKFEIIDNIIEFSISTWRFIIGSVSSKIVKDVTCNPWFITLSYCTFYTDVINPSNQFNLGNTINSNQT